MHSLLLSVVVGSSVGAAAGAIVLAAAGTPVAAVFGLYTFGAEAQKNDPRGNALDKSFRAVSTYAFTLACIGAGLGAAAGGVFVLGLHGALAVARYVLMQAK